MILNICESERYSELAEGMADTDEDMISDESPLQLTDLPEECLRLVLSHLPVVDKFRLERVCKLWQNIIYDIQPVLRFTKSGTSVGQSSNFCLNVEHRATNDDWVPQLMTFSCRTRQSPINMSVLEKVLQRFGNTLTAINLDLALINEEVFEVIANYCPNVCCISLSSSTGMSSRIDVFLEKALNKQCPWLRPIQWRPDQCSKLILDYRDHRRLSKNYCQQLRSETKAPKPSMRGQPTALLHEWRTESSVDLVFQPLSAVLGFDSISKDLSFEYNTLGSDEEYQALMRSHTRLYDCWEARRRAIVSHQESGTTREAGHRRHRLQRNHSRRPLRQSLRPEAIEESSIVQLLRDTTR